MDDKFDKTTLTNSNLPIPEGFGLEDKLCYNCFQTEEQRSYKPDPPSPPKVKKKLNIFVQCMLAFFPIVNLVAFYRINVVWKGLLISFLSLFLLSMSLHGLITNLDVANYLAIINGQIPLPNGYDLSYFQAKVFLDYGSLTLVFALPVWFVRKWTKKWNANIDKQNMQPSTTS